MIRCSCGALALRSTCPTCGSPVVRSVPTAALVLLGLAGCVGATTDEKADPHSAATVESTDTTPQPPYGLPTDYWTAEHSGEDHTGGEHSGN